MLSNSFFASTRAVSYLRVISNFFEAQYGVAIKDISLGMNPGILTNLIALLITNLNFLKKRFHSSLFLLIDGLDFIKKLLIRLLIGLFG